jgi:hypothetical protein
MRLPAGRKRPSSVEAKTHRRQCKRADRSYFPGPVPNERWCLLWSRPSRQPEHQAARAVVERDGGPLLLCPLVLAGLDYFILAGLGAQAEQKVLAELRSPAYRLAAFTDDLAGSRVFITNR